jgi:hypothetical protein
MILRRCPHHLGIQSAYALRPRPLSFDFRRNDAERLGTVAVRFRDVSVTRDIGVISTCSLRFASSRRARLNIGNGAEVENIRRWKAVRFLAPPRAKGRRPKRGEAEKGSTGLTPLTQVCDGHGTFKIFGPNFKIWRARNDHLGCQY